jgi:phosphopantothenoylcysteine decarboxylase/phosphopantothenate--cysteine ligase
MHGAVRDRIDQCDIFIAVAAVADYRPVRKATQKIKKDEARMTLELTRNPDILASVAARRNAPFTVGFAAETSNLRTHATNKLRRKRVDLIAANSVGGGIAFGSDTNALTLIDNNGAIEIGPAPKLELARTLIAEIAERYHAKNSTQDS